MASSLFEFMVLKLLIQFCIAFLELNNTSEDINKNTRIGIVKINPTCLEKPGISSININPGVFTNNISATNKNLSCLYFSNSNKLMFKNIEVSKIVPQPRRYGPDEGITRLIVLKTETSLVLSEMFGDNTAKQINAR